MLPARTLRIVSSGRTFYPLSAASPKVSTLHAAGSIIGFDQGLAMRMWIIAASVAAGVAAHGAACAQNAAAPGSPAPPNSIVLMDSTGNVAARPLNDTVMLITLSSGVAVPALIGPMYNADGRMASGLATWQAGGSVLFTSSDCTAGGYVHSLPHAGVRATTQVRTPAGIVLYVGAIGTATTVAVHSILYDTGCSPVTVQQDGLFPVLAIVNLSAAYPPPLSIQ